MRLIDADSLLLRVTTMEAVHAVKAEPTVICKTCTVNDVLTEQIDALSLTNIELECRLEKAQERIMELEGNQWIPCSERLPIFYEWVLAFTSDEDIYVAFLDNSGWQDAHFEQDNYEVVAWQPLPEPYEKE